MKNPTYIDIDSISVIKTMEIKELKSQIKEKCLDKNGRFNSNNILMRTKNDTYKETLLSNVLFYTKFIHNNDINLKMHCILNDCYALPSCGVCGSSIIKHRNYTFNKFCSSKCANSFTSSKSVRTELSRKSIGRKTAETRKKNNSYFPSDESKLKMSVSQKSAKTQNKRKLTNIERYGVENGGVLGAYSSKISKTFIRNFLLSNSIDESRCYFSGGGINNKEYWQRIESSGKFIYASYDLVVMNKTKSEIEIVLEYNGPWHYTLSDVLDDPDSPSVPYKNSKNIKTKKESYEYDKLKIDHMKKFTNNIQIFWQKTNTLEYV